MAVTFAPAPTGVSQNHPFGLKDFFRAIGYPFKHRTALCVGALIYALSMLGGLATNIMTWFVMFGCISLVINNVAVGRFNHSFLPDFEFSDWDDIVTPILLGLGIVIVSWGPMIALVITLLRGAANVGVVDATDPVTLVVSLLPYVPGKTPRGTLFLVCLLWGLFYYPMALTVAGYTQGFESVINPLVGLDTIRHMGATYFKAFAMVLVVQFIGLLSYDIAVVFPFLEGFAGNFIIAILTFYFNIVIACILGLSLFKCADRLDIYVD